MNTPKENQKPKNIVQEAQQRIAASSSKNPKLQNIYDPYLFYNPLVKKPRDRQSKID